MDQEVPTQGGQQSGLGLNSAFWAEPLIRASCSALPGPFPLHLFLTVMASQLWSVALLRHVQKGQEKGGVGRGSCDGIC